MSIGDVIFYYIGYLGLRQVAAGRLQRLIGRMSTWLENKPKLFIFTAVYSYAAFTPLPNDILAMILGAARQRLVLVLPALILGNFTLVLLLATFGSWLSF